MRLVASQINQTLQLWFAHKTIYICAVLMEAGMQMAIIL